MAFIAASSSTAAAASLPDSVAIGTPAPGCALPPARYRPGRRVRAPGRLKLACQPCTAIPYSAPPVAGNSRSKPKGVVSTSRAGSRYTLSPARSITPKLAAAAASISAVVIGFASPRAGALIRHSSRSGPPGGVSSSPRSWAQT